MAKQKRVCMLTWAPMLFDARIQREARALRDGGYKVSIIYLEDQHMLRGVPNLEKAQADYHKDMHGIKSRPIYLISRNWTFLPKIIHHAFQAFELFIKYFFIMLFAKAEFYQSHDLKPAIFAWIGSAIHGGKLVYDAHEIEVTTGGKKLVKYFTKYEKFIMKRAVIATTVNEEISEMMSTEHNKEVGIIANRPFHVEYDKVKKNFLRENIELKPEEKVLMYIGYVNPNARGIEVVVEALAHLDENVVFLIMGVGRLNEFKDYLNNFAKEKNIEHVMKRVRFIGPFPPDDIIHYLHGADISMLLYQRTSENSVSNAPNKFYQSIMARTPILASHNKTFPKYIKDNGVGSIGETVDESKPKIVAETIIQMFDEKQQKEYRKNCNLMAKEVSWEAEAKKLVSMFNSAAN